MKCLKWKKTLWTLPGATLALIPSALAHCPLCTVGAAAAAGGAMYLGVNTIVVGLFIGAFAVSTGWWISRALKKEYFSGQKWALIVLSFLLTIIPIMPLIPGITPLYISMMGDYGSLLNRTYLLNNFLLGSLVGGTIVSSTPWMSSKLTNLRKGKMLPFQRVILTLALLVVVGVIIQFAVA
jgi:hypothetical protein